VAIAFGVVAFLWPNITLVALTYLWGAYAIADGVLAIWAAFNLSGADTGSRWWLGLTGGIGIRRADWLAEHWSTGAHLDDRLVRCVLRLHVDRPIV
jgi:hypothetical protein